MAETKRRAPGEPPEVRSPQTDAEWDASEALMLREFYPNVDIEQRLAAARQRRAAASPAHRPDWASRAAFKDGALVGRYNLQLRHLRHGPARILTGCVGGVVTAEEVRGQGYGRALMRDATALAQRERWPLLLLAGIANFYGKHGYRVCCTNAEHSVDLAKVRWPEHPTHTVRDAARADAADLLRLYQGTYHEVLGSFDREVEAQRYRLGLSDEQRLLKVACTADGRVEGYLYRSGDAWAYEAHEMAASSEGATLALLAAHRDLVPEATHLKWQLPLGSRELAWLQAHADLYSGWHSPRQAGWQARLGDVGAWCEAMLPVWAERWGERAPRKLVLSIGEAEYGLQLGPGRAVLVAPAGPRAHWAPEALVQAMWGYQPVARFLDRPDLLTAEPGAAEMLAILFPVQHPFIPHSDDF